MCFSHFHSRSRVKLNFAKACIIIAFAACERSFRSCFNTNFVYRHGHTKEIPKMPEKLDLAFMHANKYQTGPPKKDSTCEA